MKMASSKAKPTVSRRNASPAITPDRRAADDLFGVISRPLVGEADVSTARMFGSICLKTSGKVFALAYKARLVVKLPAGRVESIVQAGRGEYFDPGHGRTSKEWVAVPPESDEAWLALAREARTFVGAIR